MKLSSTTIKELRSEWTGVVLMRERMGTIVMGIFAGGSPGSGISVAAAFAASDIVYNLPLLLAFDVLKKTLAEAKNEKLFACSVDCPGFKKLMRCGKNSPPWIDWKGLLKGMENRNAVAHDGELFDEKQCLQDIARVEAQLIAWNIIEAA